MCFTSELVLCAIIRITGDASTSVRLTYPETDLYKCSQAHTSSTVLKFIGKKKKKKVCFESEKRKEESFERERKKKYFKREKKIFLERLKKRERE